MSTIFVALAIFFVAVAIRLRARMLRRDRQAGPGEARRAALEDRFAALQRKRAEQDRQIAALTEEIQRLCERTSALAAAVETLGRGGAQLDEATRAEMARRALAIRIPPEQILRFNEVMDDAERKKKEIELDYQLRSALRRAILPKAFAPRTLEMTTAEMLAEASRLARAARSDPEYMARFNRLMADAERRKQEIEAEYRLRSALRRAKLLGGNL